MTKNPYLPYQPGVDGVAFKRNGRWTNGTVVTVRGTRGGHVLGVAIKSGEIVFVRGADCRPAPADPDLIHEARMRAELDAEETIDQARSEGLTPLAVIEGAGDVWRGHEPPNWKDAALSLVNAALTRRRKDPEPVRDPARFRYACRVCDGLGRICPTHSRIQERRRRESRASA